MSAGYATDLAVFFEERQARFEKLALALVMVSVVVVFSVRWHSSATDGPIGPTSAAADTGPAWSQIVSADAPLQTRIRPGPASADAYPSLSSRRERNTP